MERVLLPSKWDFGYFVKIVSVLKEGGAVVCPTDTVYGLLGDAKNQEAVNRIFAIKGRGGAKALPVFVNSYKMLDEVAYVNDENVKSFLRKSWPGQITCVLPSRGWMSLELRGSGLSIGVRMSGYPFIFKLLEAFGGPLIGTSANLSGKEPYTKIEDVVSEFKKMPLKPDLVIDAGDLPQSPPSTVVDLTQWPPKILRQGAVSKEEILNYL